ncbi:MAG: purine-nucleoside phosphorylase [Clostridiaceae bacterium]|nr:purine-nucleoside phosphorylase [Clostridiaceae bacterium]
MSTPHNQAEKGDIAAKVLMPGDPLRAKFIAETFLEDAKLVNEVRNMYAYTGTYKGHPVTVMASGMGMPSMGIYSYELFTQYGVEQIIRIGSAGAYVDELKLYDVVLADSVWSETSFARTQNGYDKDIVYPSESLNGVITAAAKELGIPLTLTRVHSSDVFYCEDNVDDFKEINRKHQCTCVDMESFALFHNASVLGKQAACLLTISDSFTSNQKATAEERQNSFTNMMKIALEACL